MLKRSFFLVVLALAMVFAARAPRSVRVSAQVNNACQFTLAGAFQNAQDPTNPSNDVIAIDTTNGATGSVTLNLPAGTKAPQLDNKISLRYYFVNRTCTGGSPRVQLAIDKDGNGTFDGNAFGYVGNAAFGGGCNPNVWETNNLTDNVPRWDLSQLGGGMTMTWSEVKTFLANNFPNYQILNISLADDSGGFASGAAGKAFYDDITFNNCVLNDRSDTFSDRDHDGVPDNVDNCPDTPNPDQLDTDGDGIGDACDQQIGPPTDKSQCKNGGWQRFNNPSFKNQGDCVSFVATGGRNGGGGTGGGGTGGGGGVDSDGDGIPDSRDNCPHVANPDQRDTDGDGIGDACDQQTGPPTDKNQCKNGGWQFFNTPRSFANQGDCIQFVKTGR